MPIAIYNLEPYGDMVLYEDYLVEVANLNHIIAALEGQLKAESQEIKGLKFQLHQLDDLASKLPRGCLACGKPEGHGGLMCPNLRIT